MSNGGGIGDDKEDTNLVGSSFSLVRVLSLIISQLDLDFNYLNIDGQRSHLYFIYVIRLDIIIQC